tara:strand:- start:12332 stop:13060 length:729 start_codon:yes stop_codon:yes gene_type:complete
MNYLNIHTDTLRGVEFIGAEPTERATWIALLGWCATQENGGVIDDCKNWKDRQWQQLAGVTVSEVKTISRLYVFEGENLRLKFYPVESEAAVRSKREKGKLGGRPRIDKSEANPYGTKDKNHMVNESANHERNERKGEWKGKKSNGTPPTIPEMGEVVSYLKQKLPKINREWTDVRVDKAASLKYETSVDLGWKDGFGKPIKNWKLKFLNMMVHQRPFAYDDPNDKTSAEIRRKNAQDDRGL